MRKAKRPRELREIMDKKGIQLALWRISAQIAEEYQRERDLAIVGIRRRGVYLAQRLAKNLQKLMGKKVPVGVLDITLYRDDLTTVATKPVVRDTQIDFNVQGKTIILVDDVLYTGRTVRAALDALMDLGRPRRVELVALIDRGHRELPIQADYVGKFVDTTEDEIVEVRLRELDDEERVVVVERAN